jgi:hypothetical protein
VIRGAVRLEQKKLTADDEDSAEIGWSRLSNDELLRVDLGGQTPVRHRQRQVWPGSLREVENDCCASRQTQGYTVMSFGAGDGIYGVPPAAN